MMPFGDNLQVRPGTLVCPSPQPQSMESRRFAPCSPSSRREAALGLRSFPGSATQIDFGEARIPCGNPDVY